MIIITTSIIFTFTYFSVLLLLVLLFSICPYLPSFHTFSVVIPYHSFHCHLHHCHQLCFFFLFLISSQLYSHKTVKVSKLLCLFALFLELESQGKNFATSLFFPGPKKFTILFIYWYLIVILHFNSSFSIFAATHFIISLF